MANSEPGKEEYELDKSSSDIIGIDPRLLAKADEDFMIYSPKRSQYVFMSKDPAITHKLHTKVETREDRNSRRTMFKLIKVEDKDCYYMYNMKTEKYVHLSGDDVLGATGKPEEHGDVSHFQLTFEQVGKTGCYRIKCNGSHFYVSSSTAGFPPNFVMHASTDDQEGMEVFQFVLGKKAKEAKIEYELEKTEKQTKFLADIVKEIENKSDEESPGDFQFKEEYPKEEGFEFYGFSYVGNYLGDLDCKQQEALCSKEILRSSPELWPEKIPGVGEFASHFGTSAVLSKSEAVASSLDSALEKDDRDMLQEFGSLTTSQLMDKVKALQNLAYQLGLEEVQRGTKLKNTMKKGWETALFLTKCLKQSMSEAGGMLGSLAREMTRGKFLNILGKSDFRR
eukprot:gene17734-19507_t